MYFHRACDSSEYSPLHGRPDLPIYAKEAKLLSIEGIMTSQSWPFWEADLLKGSIWREQQFSIPSWSFEIGYLLWHCMWWHGQLEVGRKLQNVVEHGWIWWCVCLRKVEAKYSWSKAIIVSYLEALLREQIQSWPEDHCYFGRYKEHVHPIYAKCTLHIASCLNLYCSQVLGCMSDWVWVWVYKGVSGYPCGDQLNIVPYMYMSILCLDVNMSTQNIAMVQYIFAHGEHEVKVAPTW